MKGVGRSNGAVSFVNALFSGVGSAGAISLTVEARATVEAGSAGDVANARISGESDSPLVRAALREASARYLPRGWTAAELEVSSSVPAGTGLKSSSAVSTAVIQATARAARVEPPFSEIAALSARVSREVGVSATGAFDDALACIAGGCVVTENGTLRVLRAGPAVLGDTVLLWTPEGRHPPSPEVHQEFHARAREIRPAVEAALAGRFLEAMELNGRLVEDLLHYDYAPVRAALRKAGASACGVTGLGPTLVAVGPNSAARPMRRALNANSGAVRRVRFRDPRPLPRARPG